MVVLKLVTVNQLLIFSSKKKHGKMSLINYQTMITLTLIFQSHWKIVFKKRP